LSQARNLLVHQILLSNTSVSGIGLGLLHLAQMDLPLDEPARATARYSSITAEQVKTAFATWIRPSGFVQVSSGPEPH